MAVFNRASLSPSTSRGAITDDTLFVAVTRDFDDTKSVLLWALENRHNSGICLIHIHQPDKRIPTPLGKIPINLANKHQIEAHRVIEREKLSKKLEKHLQYCRQHGVVAAKIYVEMDSIQDGIVKLVADQKIKKLVMGAAADKKYTKGMIEILSEKAKYVNQHSSSYCHIWFICKKLPIHIKEAPEESARIEGNERPRPTPSYEIDSFNRNLSSSTYRSSLSGPSAPDLCFSQVDDGKQEVDEWLFTQGMQEPCDLYPPSFKTAEAESSYSEESEKAANEELQTALDRISSYNLMVEQLERRLWSANERVEIYKKERDEMQVERNNAIKEVEEARKQSKNGHSSVNFPMIKSKLSCQDIENATSKFDQSRKVREDTYGVTYKGSFNVQFSVKIAHHEQAPCEFQQEVEIMNRIKHPNIVNLVGICLDSQALVYEYFGDVTLEDKLNCKGENEPLKWKTVEIRARENRWN